MKLTAAVLLGVFHSSLAFSPNLNGAAGSPSTQLAANIRGPTDKSETLRFGWDGTTALGGAVENAKPARMLEDIRASGEAIPDECEVGSNFPPGRAGRRSLLTFLFSDAGVQRQLGDGWRRYDVCRSDGPH